MFRANDHLLADGSGDMRWLPEFCRELEKLVQPVAPDNALGRLTRMEALNDKAVNEAALGQARERLHLLELALTRVYEKGFGVCTACEKPIPIERLLLMPQSTKCVECASG